MQNMSEFKMVKLCDCCQKAVPTFENLSKENEEYIRQLIRDGKPITAITELKNITRSSLMEAKVWVHHCGEFPAVKTIPCPYCGQALRTFKAKQCRSCLRDWHEENELKWLK
jgi:hypothetical protein